MITNKSSFPLPCKNTQHHQSQLKGFKISLKGIRKNMLLKTKGNLNFRPTPSEHSAITSSRKQKESILSTPRSPTITKNPFKQRMHSQPKYVVYGQEGQSIFYPRKGRGSDKRMNEYISLMLKHKQKERQKSMVDQLQKEGKKKQNRRSCSQPSNYCKRIKVQSSKIRHFRHQKSGSVLQIYQQPKDQDRVIQKIRKTEFYSRRSVISSISGLNTNTYVQLYLSQKLSSKI